MYFACQVGPWAHLNTPHFSWIGSGMPQGVENDASLWTSLELEFSDGYVPECLSSLSVYEPHQCLLWQWRVATLWNLVHWDHNRRSSSSYILLQPCTRTTRTVLVWDADASRQTINTPKLIFLPCDLDFLPKKQGPTRNQKHHLEGNAIPAGYSHAHMLITWVELITITIVTIPSIWQNSEASFYVFENFQREFANPVAPSTDVTTKRLVRCKGDLVI